MKEGMRLPPLQEHKGFIPPVHIGPWIKDIRYMAISVGLASAVLLAAVLAKDRVGPLWTDLTKKGQSDTGSENQIPTQVPAVVINGERYVTAPTATATIAPTETAAPPSPTATEKPAPTATSTATATAVPRILVPQSEKVFETGMVERYGMITEQNFDRFFARIPEKEFQKLIEEQPDLILFPYFPLSDKFEIGESVSSNGAGTNIKIYSPHVLLIAGVNGKLEFTKSVGSYSGLYIVQDLSEKVSIRFQNTVLGRNPKLKPIIDDAPIWKSVDSRGKDVTKGLVVAEFFGSDAFDNGKYSGAENQIGFNITKLEKLDTPVKIGPGNLTMTAKTTYLTPSLSNPDLWVHTKDGRIAIPKLQ